MLMPSDPTKPPIDPEKRIILLKSNIRNLLQTIESLKGEKKI
jgi:hypothetical protein